MKILNEFNTIRAIANTGASIARYGDGELKLCFGNKQMSQKHSPNIEKDLRNILKSDLSNLMVGLPRIYSSPYPKQNENKKKFWKRYQDQKFKDLFDPDKRYYSSFVSRPDSANEIDCVEYWDLVKEIWCGRSVVLLQGMGRQFHKEMSLWEGAESLEIVYGPRKNAYEHMDQLINILTDYPSTRLFVLSLGPAATILAFEMARRGYQALDLGHMGMFYAHYHPKSSQYTGEHYDTDKN